jgi:PAS domain S-box-containing protein
MSTGEPAGFVAADLDRALRYLRLFLTHMDEGVLIQGADGALLFANDAAARLCGFHSATEMQAAATADLLSRFAVLDETGEELPHADFPALRVSAHEPIVQTTLRWRVKATGEERWSVVKAVRIPDEHGETEFLLHLFRDITDQHRAEATLRASEARFRPLVQNISDIVKVFAADGTILYQSPSVQRILGYAPEERGGTNIFTQPIVHPEDMPKKQHFIVDALQQPGVPVTGEFRLRHSNGSWRDIEAVGVNLLDDPHVAGIVATYRDVTERKHEEARERYLSAAGALLAGSLDYETTLQRVAELAVPGIADWCGVDILTNTGTLESVAVAHVDPEKVTLAREYRDRYEPDPQGDDAAMAVLQTGEPLLIPVVTAEMLTATARDAEQLRIMRALGLESVMVVPLIARGRVLGRVTFISSDPRRRFGPSDLALARELARRAAVAIDNARLYHAEQAAAAQYRGLFTGSVDAVLIADARGNYRDANPAMTALVGYSVEELRQMGIGDLTAESGEARPPRIDALQGDAWRGELQFRHKNGTLIPVEGAITQIQLPEGTTFLGTFRDVTERKQREQMERTFIGMVAHELKNPLTTMKGYSQLIVRRGTINPHALATITREADRAARLIDDLVDATRIDAGHLTLNLSKVEICSLVRTVVRQEHMLEPEHPISINLPDGPIYGMWDPDRIMQVLINLLTNAAKYSPAGSPIDVDVTEGAGSVTVSVRDRGIGIPPEALLHLFTRFFRAPNARESSAKGIGLGLYISKALITAHGGSMGVQSRQGEGVTFHFILPCIARSV